MTAADHKELETDVQISPDGHARVILRSRLDVHAAGACWGLLEKNLRGANIKTLEVDASGLRHCDGGGLALLQY